MSSTEQLPSWKRPTLEVQFAVAASLSALMTAAASLLSDHIGASQSVPQAAMISLGAGVCLTLAVEMAGFLLSRTLWLVAILAADEDDRNTNDPTFLADRTNLWRRGSVMAYTSLRRFALGATLCAAVFGGLRGGVGWALVLPFAALVIEEGLRGQSWYGGRVRELVVGITAVSGVDGAVPTYGAPRRWLSGAVHWALVCASSWWVFGAGIEPTVSMDQRVYVAGRDTTAIIELALLPFEDLSIGVQSRLPFRYEGASFTGVEHGSPSSRFRKVYAYDLAAVSPGAHVMHYDVTVALLPGVFATDALSWRTRHTVTLMVLAPPGAAEDDEAKEANEPDEPPGPVAPLGPEAMDTAAGTPP